jgi:CheY-like chemotaxis protein
VIGGVAPSIAEAVALIAGPQRFDVATLNINLQGQTSEAVAIALDARGIPFVVITGYDKQYLLPAFQGRPILQKPFQLKQLAEALGALGLP